MPLALSRSESGRGPFLLRLPLERLFSSLYPPPNLSLQFLSFPTAHLASRSDIQLFTYSKYQVPNP